MTHLPDLRVGTGLDVHAFCEGDHVVLGGVQIPHERALEGHSDADVLIHAIMDGLLGASALGDIGEHFPPSDPSYSGVQSTLLLRRVMELVRAGGWEIVNIDSVVAAEAPRLAPHVTAMRSAIAAAASTDAARIAVKATSFEGIGFVGRREGIAAISTVLLAKV